MCNIYIFFLVYPLKVHENDMYIMNPELVSKYNSPVKGISDPWRNG